jgi:hypothetical protein
MTLSAYYKYVPVELRQNGRRKTVIRALLAVVVLAARASEPGGDLDTAFEKIPFAQWLTSPDQGAVRWTVRASHPELSYHQRLVTRVEVQMDGADLAGHRQNGELVFFIQLADPAGRRYQNHGSIDLGKLEDGVRSQYLTYTQLIFVTPGDYRVSIAILETATSQHSTRQFDLSVPPLKNDPLPDAWRNLPAVEFVRAVEPPESWYQPGSASKLNLRLAPRQPVYPRILVNVAASERAVRRRAMPHRELNSLMTTLDVISQLQYSASPLPVSLLDVSRRKVVLRQPDAQTLDWDAVKNALAETDPGIVDVKSLENRHQNAHFFVEQVRRQLDAPLPDDTRDGPRVVIVLSGVVEFEPGEDLQPINVERPGDCRVYYFRFHSLQAARTASPITGVPGHRPHSGRTIWDTPIAPSDQLAATLKPLSPRIYDIDNPEQFRKALARMLGEIAAL